jgi:hypothetical protein
MVSAVTPTSTARGDNEFQRLLDDCQIPAVPTRPGLLAFDAACLVRQLAERSGLNQDASIHDLERWARSLGGQLDGSVLFLPGEKFDTT